MADSSPARHIGEITYTRRVGDTEITAIGTPEALRAAGVLEPRDRILDQPVRERAEGDWPCKLDKGLDKHLCDRCGLGPCLMHSFKDGDPVVIRSDATLGEIYRAIKLFRGVRSLERTCDEVSGKILSFTVS